MKNLGKIYIQDSRFAERIFGPPRLKIRNTVFLEECVALLCDFRSKLSELFGSKKYSKVLLFKEVKLFLSRCKCPTKKSAEG